MWGNWCKIFHREDHTHTWFQLNVERPKWHEIWVSFLIPHSHIIILKICKVFFTYLANSNPTRAISLINRELTLELQFHHVDVVDAKLEAQKKYTFIRGFVGWFFNLSWMHGIYFLLCRHLRWLGENWVFHLMCKTFFMLHILFITMREFIRFSKEKNGHMGH